jgi:hypothetical protein
MARMIPDIAPAMQSPGEAELFARFRDEPGTDDWTVLHSFDLSQHVARISGEVDFVVIVPGRGVLVLEVKAVRSVRRENGVWFLGRAEQGDPLGPFKQAADAMHSLRDAVARRDSSLRAVIFWSAVVFPYVTFRESSAEWHDWQVIDKDTLQNGLAAAILRVLDLARHHLAATRSAKWFNLADPRPTPREAMLIVRVLRRDFEVYESPVSRMRRLANEVLRYTEEQYAALDAMADNDRVIFDGAAGTGKTMLAIEAARRAAQSGARVMLVCFNRALGRWIAGEVVDHDAIVAGTLHSQLLRVSGLSPSDEPEFWSEHLPSVALDVALKQEDSSFDVVVIDEGQDMLRTAYFDYFDIALSAGLRAGRWRIFGDFTNQRIYRQDSAEPEELLKEYGALAPRFRLTENCRNTPRIATYAGILGGVPDSYRRIRRPDNGINAETKFYNNANEQRQELVSVLETLERDGFSGDAIVILSSRATGACSDGLAAPPWSDRRCGLDDLKRGRVRCATIHAFKGLEAAAVVLTDIEQFEMGDRNLFYVGASRALDRVIVLAHERTRQGLSRALFEVGAPTNAA